MHIYSASRPCREFLGQLLVNCIFLQIFHRFSQPRMIYYLLVVILESEEQKKAVEMNEEFVIETIGIDEIIPMKKNQ